MYVSNNSVRRHHFHKANNNTDPLEIVSPKLTFGRNSEWREDVKKHWATLLQLGDVKVDEGCATHVHVSPKKEKLWSLEQLKQFAKAVIYFDDAFKKIWAPSRRDHGLTQSNKRHSSRLKECGFVECCKSIENCADNKALFNLMQQSRDYAWNFENTFENPEKKEKAIGTIGASHDS